MYGAELLYSALNSTVFRREEDISKLIQLTKDLSSQEFLNKINESYLDGYRFSWMYLDQLANRISLFNNDNPFCAYGRRRNTLYIEYFNEALRRHWRNGCITLDLGCGRHAPLTSSLVMRLNGAAQSYAIDVAPDAAPDQTLEGLRRLISDAVSFPEYYLFPGNERGDLLKRLIEINLSRATPEDLMLQAEKNGVHYRVMDFGAYGDLPYLDFVHSVSVLEHIPDVELCFRTLRSRMNPGAAMCHVVDFSDHAAIVGKAPHRWHHLTTEGTRYGINGHRLSYIALKMEEAGFSVEVSQKVIEQPPPGVRENLKDEYRGISDEDLRCYQATIIAVAR